MRINWRCAALTNMIDSMCFLFCYYLALLSVFEIKNKRKSEWQMRTLSKGHAQILYKCDCFIVVFLILMPQNILNYL